MRERLSWKNEYSSYSLSYLSHGHHRPCLSSTIPLTLQSDPVQSHRLRLFHVTTTEHSLVLLSICAFCPLLAWHDVEHWALLISSHLNSQHTYRSGIDLRILLDAPGIDIPWLCSQCRADHSNSLIDTRSYFPPSYHCLQSRIVAGFMTTNSQIELFA